MKCNLLEWHFSLQGAEGSPYDKGIYHGRIRLDPEYPRKAPSITMLTPSGRWQPYADICLSASAYHQESWDPNWNLRTLVLSLRGFMTSKPREIGGIQSSLEEAMDLAVKSRTYRCPHCGVDHKTLDLSEGTHIKASRNTEYLGSGDAFVSISQRKGATKRHSSSVPQRKSSSIFSQLHQGLVSSRSFIMILLAISFTVFLNQISIG